MRWNAKAIAWRTQPTLSTLRPRSRPARTGLCGTCSSHLGGVHRWAGEHIRDRLPRVLQVDDFRDLVGEWPDDAALVDWYRDELQLFLDTFCDWLRVISTAPGSSSCPIRSLSGLVGKRTRRSFTGQMSKQSLAD